LQAIATDQVKVVATNQPERHIMIKRNLTIEAVRNWAFGQLSLAQHHFSLNPNSTNWNRSMFAMYVYQQTEQAFPSAGVDTDKLLAQLNAAQQRYWGDLISMATVGKLVKEVLPTAEFVAIETA
jgi:hypothetical protein